MAAAVKTVWAPDLAVRSVRLTMLPAARVSTQTLASEHRA